MHYYYSHFKGKEIEVQGSDTAALRSHTNEWHSQDMNTGGLAPVLKSSFVFHSLSLVTV